MNETVSRRLPVWSNASIDEGMWYVFRDGDHIIRAWGSSWTRLKRVYIDDIVVHRYDSGRHREHYAFASDGQIYRIHCRTKNLQRWQVECELWKNDQLVQVIRCKRRKLWNLRPTLAHLSVGLAAGIIGGMLRMPWWFGIVFIFASLTTTLLTTAKTDRFVFEVDE